jgi:hypothetical protein
VIGRVAAGSQGWALGDRRAVRLVTDMLTARAMVAAQRRCVMLNRIKAMWARLWRRRDRRTVEHDYYDQHEASRYRTLHESRQDGDLPF